MFDGLEAPVLSHTETSITMAWPLNQLLEVISRLDPATPEFEPLKEKPLIYTHSTEPYHEIVIGPSVDGLKISCLKLIVAWVEAIIEVFMRHHRTDACRVSWFVWSRGRLLPSGWTPA